MSSENFIWDGLALIKRNDVNYTIEPHVNGGSPILSTNASNATNATSILFNDMLGTTIGSVVTGELCEIRRDSFGSPLTTYDRSPTTDFFTGKPQVEGLGYAFLFRNYRPELGKWQTADPLGYPDGWNNLAYVNNGVTMAFDWLGGWTIAAHNFLLAEQFSNMSDSDIAAIQAGSSYVDRFENQDPNPFQESTAYQHSMSAPGQSIADAINMRNDFITQSLNSANNLIDSDRNQALNLMGQALHAIQDSYCPLHVDSNGNPIEWNFWSPGAIGHALGSEGISALTQEIIDQIQQTSANYLMNYPNLVNAITPKPE